MKEETATKLSGAEEDRTDWQLLRSRSNEEAVLRVSPQGTK